MKKFLSDLVGMTVVGATYLCEKEGYKAVRISDFLCNKVRARPDLVILWEGPKGKVRVATACMPIE